MTQFSLPKSPKQVSWPSLRVIWYRSQNWARNPTVTIGIILSVFAAYLILAPVIMMLMDAFTVDFADQARASKLEGELTSYYLNRAMNSPIAKYIFWLPLMNTLFCVHCGDNCHIAGGWSSWLVGQPNRSIG